MKSIPPDELIHIIQHWINQDWPLTEEQAKQACRNLGWTENEDGDFDPPYDLNIKYTLLGIDERIGQLSLLEFRVSDAMPKKSMDRDTFMNDLFEQYVTKFKTRWGKPQFRRKKDFQRASWMNLENGCRLDLVNGMSSQSCYIYSPEYAEVERYLGERGL